MIDEELLIAAEPCTLTELGIEPEDNLRDLPAFGPASGESVDALGVAAVDEDHVPDPVVNPVEGAEQIVSKFLGVCVSSMTMRPPENTTGVPAGMACAFLLSARARMKARPSTMAEVMPGIGAAAAVGPPAVAGLGAVEHRCLFAHDLERLP